MKKGWMIALFVMLACVLVFMTQITFFVVQPLGALPEGGTLVTWRTGKLHFIESADAICAREMCGVSLLCCMTVLRTIADP